jgi:hypothetical protein
MSHAMTGERHRANALGVLAFVLLAACGGGEESELLTTGQNDDVVFLVQNVPPEAVMDALFQGRIESDGNGCLRLSGPDAATVVWPYGASLDADDGQVHVRDARGRRIGTIGGAFRFGGGEVTTLTAGMGVSAADAGRALSRCPGRYWIVGDVMSPTN